jgi:UDP-N-acetylglucosamine--N-acetylmuramyl-(pentapeptide) pyrophosphoryl-undecaprenol N-acetylglucosamine transferase
LKDNKYRDRYKVVPYLNTLGIRMTAGIADLVIARSGSGHISEVSVWGIPSIMVPLKTSYDNHQHFNAFAYARTGACSVLEVDNLSGDIVMAEIKRIMEDTDLYTQMQDATKEFRYPEAAQTIAEELLRLGSHNTKNNESGK